MHNDIERQNFWTTETLFINKNFASELWANISKELETNEENGLVMLYSSLLDELKNPIHCDEFLKHVMQYELNSDIIVHILNPVSFIRTKLSNWDGFVTFANKELRKELSAKEVDLILRVII